jgi:hypothetical protein
MVWRYSYGGMAPPSCGQSRAVLDLVGRAPGAARYGVPRGEGADGVHRGQLSALGVAVLLAGASWWRTELVVPYSTWW